MAKFEKGQVKTGGRRAGSLNKKTVAVDEILANLKINLVAKCIEAIESNCLQMQVDYWLKLMEFVYPKRKAIEMDLQGNVTMEKVIQRFDGSGERHTVTVKPGDDNG